jgi:hypothetical protein
MGNRKVILQTGFTFAQKLYLKMRNKIDFIAVNFH